MGKGNASAELTTKMEFLSEIFSMFCSLLKFVLFHKSRVLQKNMQNGTRRQVWPLNTILIMP
jgi:hypothetical protein